METRSPEIIVLSDSSEEIDNADTKNTKPRTSIDSVYSTDSNTSRYDASGEPEEDDFSQLKPGSSKRRVLPNVSTDDESASQSRPRKSSDSQYSSDGVVKSPKKRASLKRKIASDSEESDGPRNPTSDDAVKSPKKRTSVKRRIANDSDESDGPQNPTSDDAVKSPKKRTSLKRRIASESEESDGSQNPTERTRKRKTKRQPQNVVSSSSETDNVSQAGSDGSRTEELSDSSNSPASNRSEPQAGPSRTRTPSVTSYTTDECEDFIQVGSDSEVSETSSGPSQASEVRVATRTSPRKYANLRIGSDSSDEGEDEGAREPEPVEESPQEIRRRQQLEIVHKKLKNKILYAKAAEIRDIVAGHEQLVLPEFSELLWQAVTYNKIDPEKPAILVRAGVDVNSDGTGEYSGNSVLHVVVEKALRKGFEGLAFTLIQHGAEIDWINCEGKTVLHSAVIGGSKGVVEELMRRNVVLGDRYNKILQVAAEGSSLEILRMLVEYKVEDKETKIGRAMHALRCLVENGNDLVAMKMLLDYNLPLDNILDDGQTLLHRAIILSRKEMVQLLLEYGANPRHVRRDGSLPLWHAALHPTAEIAGLLIKHGASVHDHNYVDGAYPIHKACNAMSSENIRLFLYLGAEVNVMDNDDRTPFCIMYNSDMNDANKAMIQHFAFLTSKNAKIRPRDLAKIRGNPVMRKYYAQCLTELEKMKRLVLFEDISLHSILNYDVDKISLVTKNTKMIDVYHENRGKITSDFPIYSSRIRKRMMTAWWRRDKLSSIESAIEEASKYILTSDVCEKIAYLACYESFIDYDLKEKSYYY